MARPHERSDALKEAKGSHADRSSHPHQTLARNTQLCFSNPDKSAIPSKSYSNAMLSVPGTFTADLQDVLTVHCTAARCDMNGVELDERPDFAGRGWHLCSIEPTCAFALPVKLVLRRVKIAGTVLERLLCCPEQVILNEIARRRRCAAEPGNRIGSEVKINFFCEEPDRKANACQKRDANFINGFVYEALLRRHENFQRIGLVHRSPLSARFEQTLSNRRVWPNFGKAIMACTQVIRT